MPNARLWGLRKRTNAAQDTLTRKRWRPGLNTGFPQDEQREEFFIEQTLKEGPDAQSILMLLGDLHVDAVGDKLRKLGYPVMVNHGLFPVRRWRP
jgi:hypothetical protein